eukprot:COSAG02_NODE_27813_length_602_cov_0.815109_1_plen_100_part_10
MKIVRPAAVVVGIGIGIGIGVGIGAGARCLTFAGPRLSRTVAAGIRAIASTDCGELPIADETAASAAAKAHHVRILSRGALKAVTTARRVHILPAVALKA